MNRNVLASGSSCVGESGVTYSILRFVGSGAIGVVYEAEDNVRSKYALKALSPDQRFLLDASLLANVKRRFKREALYASKVAGRRVVRVLDYGMIQDMPFLVMEFIDGFALSHRERLGNKSYLELLSLCTEVAKGVQEIHLAGCIHRDIKPANILFDQRSGVPKIGDFGIVKWSELLVGTLSSTLTASKDHLGTFNYMSPEQRQNPESVSSASDIYSLALSLYEILTGITLQPEAAVTGNFAPVASHYECSAEIDRLIRSMLAFKPPSRPSIEAIIKTLVLIRECEAELIQLGYKKSATGFTEFECECGCHLCRTDYRYCYHSGPIEVDIERYFCLRCGKHNEHYDREVEFE